jgi:phosphoribosyl-AMP cyclohydrolase
MGQSATSGHYQDVQSISLDCDGDALIMQVIQTGGHAIPEIAPVFIPLELRS